MPPASTPVGRRGTRPEARIQVDLRKSATIYGREYSDHAIERMQERGFTPSVIENSIQNGKILKDNTPGRINHFDITNNITVVTEEQNGMVITIFSGSPKSLKGYR